MRFSLFSEYRQGPSIFVSAFCLAVSLGNIAIAQTADIKKLKQLSIEELMNIQVTSVSKTPELLNEVASAIQVITREDIVRSGATSVPEALRLASNLQVAQLNSSAWIIGTRGFNTVFQNKLLVLIDGRTVYTPLFGGVLWEFQNVLIEDVDRIEVISGPGGSLWGANAVNGVINIITKNARDTQGLYVTQAIGNFLRSHTAVRYGGKIGDKFYYRVYAQQFLRGNTYRADDSDNIDDWNLLQGGIRFGWYPTEKDHLSVTADVQDGERETEPEKSPFDSQNIRVRWTHATSEMSDILLQVYYDRYWRDDRASLGDEMETYDVDFQHRINFTPDNRLVWGVGYRHVADEVYNRTPFAGLLPAKKELPVYSGFFHNELTFRSRYTLTVGSKFLHNVYSGFEFQPSLRIAARLKEKQTIWAAVSRAVRAPSRFDVDYFLPLEPQPPSVPSVAGGPNFDSEKMESVELGYRLQPNQKSSFSLATFYNRYRDVYSVEPLPETLTYQIQNGSEAETWGGEFSGFYQVADAWRLRGGFTYFAKDLRAKEGRMHDPSYLSNDARHMALIQSMLDLPGNLEFDLVARYLDYIPASFATPGVPEYFTFDARLAWAFKNFEIAAVGQNLYKKRHTEFGAELLPRSVFGRLTCRF